ncbi:MAG: phosphoenolpyruvate--protein phosphotransferase [Candidatus Izimaplasma sp.]|nr:phosphoenolpyruvate--protein phosphotransferase [Candidatus Izimaplasma bacterium]
MKKIKGIAASDGIAIANVFILEDVDVTAKKETATDLNAEKEKLKDALKVSELELEAIKDKTLNDLDEAHAMIFDAHIQIVNDPEMARQVEEKINTEHVTAAYAYQEVANGFAETFKAMDNEYMQERAADVVDVSRRVIAHLLNIKLNDPTTIDEEVIVVANDLTPSDTAQLNKEFVRGFITNIGGRTSHSAIMARSLEIPAIVGTKKITELVTDGDCVILDGLDGEVIINPDENTIKAYHDKGDEYAEKVEIWQQYMDKSSTTTDDHSVEIAANIGSPDDLEAVKKNGAEGIGLYRTEFLYMNSDEMPTENAQFVAYKKVLDAMKDKKVIIRTLDIGGDKHLDYLPLDEELNPFLGHRALRLCLAEKEMFKTQLRALLRASKYGNLHIMFPMVATLNELREAKAVLAEAKKECIANNQEVGEPKVGIMVEIPSVAILADQFAKEVDFFSIGTNDLIQYTFAAGRMNEKVSYLYQPYNPSLLRLIKMVIDASHDAGIWTGMCGEMAGDSIAAPILLGLGLDEFSMSASSVLRTRHLFSQLSFKEMQKEAQKVLDFKTNQEVKEYIENRVKEKTQ